MMMSAFAETVDCISIEEIASVASGDVSPSATLRVRTHAATCIRCDSELRLAEEFFDDVDEIPGVDLTRAGESAIRTLFEDAPHVVDRAGSLRSRRSWWLLAACLVLGVALWSGVRSAGIGSLPAPAAHSIVRSETIAPVEPRGRLVALPNSLEWERADGATSYRVDLRRVDRAVIWSAEVDELSVRLPVSLSETLRENTRYHWVVLGLDKDGRVVAKSPNVGFIVDDEASS